VRIFVQGVGKDIQKQCPLGLFLFPNKGRIKTMTPFEKYKKDMSKILWVTSEWDFYDDSCGKQPQTQILTAYSYKHAVEQVKIHQFINVTRPNITIVQWEPTPEKVLTRSFKDHETGWRYAWRRLMRVKGNK
jgi:hypothetical protein